MPAFAPLVRPLLVDADVGVGVSVGVDVNVGVGMLVQVPLIEREDSAGSRMKPGELNSSPVPEVIRITNFGVTVSIRVVLLGPASIVQL
jgi:hypothetical protein